MNAAFTKAGHIDHAIREVEPGVGTHQLRSEEEESVRMVQVDGDFAAGKRPRRQIGSVGREASAGRINFLIFIEARGRRVVEREMRRNERCSCEQETDDFHGWRGADDNSAGWSGTERDGPSL